MKKKLAGLAVALCLAGCVTVPKEQIAAADTGQAPDAEKIVKSRLAATLKDPDSVKQLQIEAPEKCANRRASWKAEFGWCLRYSYNAKNSYGGYVGVTHHSLMIQGEKVIMEDGVFVDGWASQL